MARVGVYSRFCESVCPTSICRRRLEEKLLPRAGDLSRDPGPLQFFFFAQDFPAAFRALQRHTANPRVEYRFVSDSPYVSLRIPLISQLPLLNLFSYQFTSRLDLFPEMNHVHSATDFHLTRIYLYLPCNSWFARIFSDFDWRDPYFDLWCIFLDFSLPYSHDNFALQSLAKVFIYS